MSEEKLACFIIAAIKRTMNDSLLSEYEKWRVQYEQDKRNRSWNPVLADADCDVRN